MLAVTSLDRACLRAILSGIGVVLVSFAVLRLLGDRVVAMQFLAFALPTWLLVGSILWRGRGDVGASSLGVSTHLTLLRGLLVSLVAGFALVTPVGLILWLPGLLYTAAALSDRYDGIVARRLRQVTAFGASLDVAMDGLGLFVAPMVAIIWRRLPPWYLLVGAAYYLFHGGIVLRRRWGLPAHVDRLRPSRVTRFFAGIQMTLVATALFPVFGLRTTTVASSLLMLPTLVFFARDWLIVTGALGSALRPQAHALDGGVAPEESLA